MSLALRSLAKVHGSAAAYDLAALYYNHMIPVNMPSPSPAWTLSASCTALVIAALLPCDKSQQARADLVVTQAMAMQLPMVRSPLCYGL